MWRVIGVFAVLFVIWWALLWWLMPPAWQHFTLAALLVIHLLPPILPGLGWLAWRGQQARRDAAAQAAAEKQAEEDRETKRAAAREQHQLNLAQRQQSIACRLVLARAMPGRAPAQWLGSEPEYCNWQTLQAEELQSGSPLHALAAPARTLLAELYGMAPGAAWLPVYLAALPNEAGRAQLSHVTELASQAILTVADLENGPAPTVRFLPGSGGLAEQVQQLLQHEPHQPGLVVAAFDAPAALVDPDDEPDHATREQRAWSGAPGAAVVAMLFLRDNLPAPVASTEVTGQQSNPYQPYWEKDPNQSVNDWGNVPAPLQAGLAQLPVLARLSLAVGQDTSHPPGPHLTNTLQTALDNALVNAALIDYPFSEEERDPAKDQADRIGWLVHNSGDAHVGGTRLAALGNALSYHKAAINPIDQASNLVREWGDTGHCTSILATALAVTHCARLSAPVVLSHFEPNYLSIGLAVPPTAT